MIGIPVLLILIIVAILFPGAMRAGIGILAIITLMAIAGSLP